MPTYRVACHSIAAGVERVGLRTWNLFLGVFLLLDVALLLVARPLHEALFEGELGLVELPTFLVLAFLAGVAIWGALRENGRTRTFLIALALGAFYWGGEEVSWGQTFFHWATPTEWAKGNYQKEANLHNERGIVGTLLNQTPRFVLTVAMIAIVLLAVPAFERFREKIEARYGKRWLVPLAWCLTPAILALVAAAVNKTRPLGYRDFGETEELYMAIALFTYAVGLIRSRSVGTT